MERVSKWVADCARSREASGDGGKTQGCVDLDGETEDLLLRVLLARPKFHKVPSIEEVHSFASQLRAYNTKLWALHQTRGYFRAAPGAAYAQVSTIPTFPAHIDDVDVTVLESNPPDPGHVRGSTASRKISPMEQQLMDEMIQRYWAVRRNKERRAAAPRQGPRTASNTAAFGPSLGDLTCA